MGLELFKVIENDAVRYTIYDFLFVGHYTGFELFDVE